MALGRWPEVHDQRYMANQVHGHHRLNLPERNPATQPKNTIRAVSRLSYRFIREACNFIFYSEFSSLEVADKAGIRQRTVKFIHNHHLKGRVVCLELLDTLLNSHTCSPFKLKHARSSAPSS